MRRIRWIACLFYWLTSTLAHAQPSARVDSGTEADVRFELGVAAQRQGRFVAALQHYLASQRLAPNENVVFNIAVCFERLGRFPEAYRYYAEYLASDLSAQERTVGREAVDRIRGRVALIRVETDPPNATVYLDRRNLGARGRTPIVLAVEPGRHRVMVEAEGYEGARSGQLRARIGREAVARLSLTRILGAVRVTGEPADAAIRIDETDTPALGRVPATIEAVPGPHTVIVSAPGHQTQRMPVVVRAKKTTRVEVSLPLETGTVVVDAEERGALIEIDGEAAGFTPAVLASVPSGEHTVRISRGGFRPYEERIAVLPNRRTTVNARLRLQEEVTAASREAESIDDAPASVSLISQAELRAFGYQTLWDAVGGQRGVYQTNDLTYASIGLRGFSSPSDYGNRLLVTLDGHTMNDDYIGSSYVGYDARTDLLDVEHLELVRGPGSALYGTNAFFGVLNVVTRDRDSMMRPYASIATDASRSVRLRTGASAKFDRDVGMWVSAGGIYSQGQDYFFPEYADRGTIEEADPFHAYNAALRGWAGDFTLEASFHRREKRIPTGAFQTIIGDPRTNAADTRGFVELRYEPRFGKELSLYVRTFADLYLYDGNFAYESEPPAPAGQTEVNHDEWRGVWAGIEARAAWSPVEWMRVTAGAEGRGSVVGIMQNRVDNGPNYLDPPGNDGFEVAGAYAVLDIEPVRALSINLGGRADYVSTFGDVAFSPRAAVITRPWQGGTIKLMGGSAFRAPSPYELLYNDNGLSQIASGPLEPERIWTGELEVSQRVDETVFLVSGFYNRIENLIDTVDITPDVFQFQNVPDIYHTIGGEAEVRRDFRKGWMVAATYSFQRTRRASLLRNGTTRRANSPEHLFGVRAIATLVPDFFVLATRLRIEGPRLGEDQNGQLIEGEIPVLADFIVSGQAREFGLSWAAGLRNLFDWRHTSPVDDDLQQTFVPLPGRTLFVQTTVEF